MCKIYAWCCDYNSNSGEGILAQKFIKDLKNNNKKKKIIIKYSRKNNIHLKNFTKRFILPLKGILYLWYIYFKNDNKKTCYVNFLPLWNFLIFLLLPPNTILGPITGGSRYLKKPFINYFLRKYFLNFFYSISIIIIKVRYKSLLFSTDLLKNKFKKKNNFFFNYILKDVKISKSKIDKKFDLIFYLRNHTNKSFLLQKKLAIELSNKFKIITVGEKISYKKIKNFGFISRIKLNKVLGKTKFSFISPENHHSFFAIDCYRNKVFIIYNKAKNQSKSLLHNSYNYNYNNSAGLKRFISKKISIYKKPSNNKIKNIKNFNDYFVL